jgi:flagellar hook capping protein FlgD
MIASSWHPLALYGALAIAFGADARAQERSEPQRGPGIVVLHFAPATSGESGQCAQGSTPSAGTLFRQYRTAGGASLTITGHVALRFKVSTGPRQIDSLIAATGIEAFAPDKRSRCRRYVLSLVHPENDAAAIADALRASGLVDYATPDLSAGRPEGIVSDSFFVDERALNAVARTVETPEVAPATYGMGQVLTAYTGPLMRVDGATLSAQMSGVTSSASAVELVKSHGITSLRLEIPDRNPLANVRVVLYSLNGTPIRQLVNEELQAGRYLLGWDGMDDTGRRVQAGVYVVVMTAGSFRETHRLVVR